MLQTVPSSVPVQHGAHANAHARAFTHEAFVMCDVANCDSRATHSGCENSSSSCRVCSAHCTCFNHDAKCFTSAPSPTDECFLGAHKLRLFWERTRDIPETKAAGIEAIGFDDRVPPEVRERVWAAIVEHRLTSSSRRPTESRLPSRGGRTASSSSLELSRTGVLSPPGVMALRGTF